MKPFLDRPTSNTTAQDEELDTIVVSSDNDGDLPDVSPVLRSSTKESISASRSNSREIKNTPTSVPTLATVTDSFEASSSRSKVPWNTLPLIPHKNRKPVTKTQMLHTVLLNSEREVDVDVVKRILDDVLNIQNPIQESDICGLDNIKSKSKETIMWPMDNPKLFTGLRKQGRGVLLYGPPGTGKSLIGKWLASKCNSTFFYLSSSSITSKWLGDSEKIIKTLFHVARVLQPSIIFIDEVDSLLSQRGGEREHESSRRIKTEFLINLDGCKTNVDDKVVIIGATNLPWEIEAGARRRFPVQLYVPLPDEKNRGTLMRYLLNGEHHNISDEEFAYLTKETDGYSAADVKNLCQQAAMGPIRSVNKFSSSLKMADMRPINFDDFVNALRDVRPSVLPQDLQEFQKWRDSCGCK